MCAPPTLPGLKLCSHGLSGPCIECWGIGYHQRRCRKHGGPISIPRIEYVEQQIAEVRERIAGELARLPDSGLTADQISGLDEALREEQRSSMRYWERELRRERAA